MPPKSPSETKASVLVIDDSPAIRSAVARRLREVGLDVREAADGRSAMSVAFERPPAVVVTDLWMPGMSGLQLCRLLGASEATSGTHVVLLTAADDPRTRFWAKRSGAAAFFAKHELGAMVDTVLRLAATPPNARNVDTAPLLDALPDPQDRLCALLDDALCEQVIVSEVRDLADAGETLEELFDQLVKLTVHLLRHRFFALECGDQRFVHCAPGAQREAEKAMRAPPTRVTEDSRLEDAAHSLERIPVRYGDNVATLTVSGTFTDADRRFVRMIARELGGPLRVVSLIAECVRNATTDPLTGLLNRRAFSDAIEREMILCERDRRPLSVLMLDVDHFKRINDAHGHATGDETLRRLARLLRATGRRSDLLARWGGEEFIVALPSTTAQGASTVADRFRRATRALLAEANTPEPVTVSIGHSTLQEGDTLQTLLGRADQALYRAKKGGRDRVEAG